MYLLGYDIGSSSVKAAVVDAESGNCIATSHFPKQEAPIQSKQIGWAEQRPDDWWEYLMNATHELQEKVGRQRLRESVEAIGISYQMHGLVCVDSTGRPVRNAIIWCDSRAVPYGEQAAEQLGEEYCLRHLLNQPGNFTAAKMAWVRTNEPASFDKTAKIMLPGDYIAMRLTGHCTTTASGLSEGMMWDYTTETVCTPLLEAMGIPSRMIAEIVPTFDIQGELTAEAAETLGLRKGVKIAYRAGDQPNNALSLGVLNPGEVAATAGTSGAVYGLMDHQAFDPQCRVNTFVHVNHRMREQTRLGVLLCVNGTGSLNSWCHREVCPELTYNEMNTLAATVPIGADGLVVLPFGNGAERILDNRDMGGSVIGLNFNRHGRAHLLRATQEGIVFALAYGMEVMAEMGIPMQRIRAGRANMFLSPLFAEALASTTGATIEMIDTDGAVGAARGAGIGIGYYPTPHDAFERLQLLQTITPTHVEEFHNAYEHWKEILKNACNRA